MNLMNQKARSGNPARKTAAILFGLGLILLGAMVALLIFKPASPASPSSSNPNRNSVIPMDVSFQAPDLTLIDLTGNQVSLADYRGQVILVNNWATWCPPCKAEMPDLQAYYEKHQHQGFVLIGIESGESASEVAQFVESFRLTFPIWLDPQGVALQVFQNYNLPNSYVIDRTGMVRLTWTGAIRAEVLEDYVTQIITE